MIEEIEIRLHLQELERQIASFRAHRDTHGQGASQTKRSKAADSSFWSMGSFFAPPLAAQRIPLLEELLR